jgi:hypothetical protein
VRRGSRVHTIWAILLRVYLSRFEERDSGGAFRNLEVVRLANQAPR